MSLFYPSYSNTPSIIIDTLVLFVVSLGMSREHPTSPENPRTTRPAANISVCVARGNNPSVKRHASRPCPPRRANSPVQAQPFVRVARSNPSRINTSVNPSFFIKSLIMNDLKRDYALDTR